MVNDVSIINKFSIVKKQFNSTAIGTGIEAPLLRSEIERRINIFLQKEINNKYEFLAVPKILDYDADNNIIYFEYIKGLNLLDSNKNEYPPFPVWNELFNLLNDLLKKKLTQINELFNDIEPICKECQKKVYKYKFPNNTFDKIKLEYLCLGDVNLSNMIWTYKKLYLFDFEFAHVGAKGFDIGQILGHLKVINDIPFISNNLLEKEMIYWKEQFTNYYSNKTK